MWNCEYNNSTTYEYYADENVASTSLLSLNICVVYQQLTLFKKYSKYEYSTYLRYDALMQIIKIW